MKKHTKIFNIIMSILIIIFIIGMPVFYFLMPDRDFSDSENRVLAKIPKLSLKEVSSGSFTSNFEKYISDQVPLRDLWINLKSSNEKLLGKKDNNGVYLGADGYLLQKISKPDGSVIKKNIDAINSFAKVNPKVKKYFMLIPNSVKVLENKLPKYASPVNQLDYINKVKATLDNGIKFVDTYEILKANSDKYIYYKTDHHWTSLGAFYGYTKLAETIGFKAEKIENYKIDKITDEFYGTLYSKGGFRNIEPDSIELFTPPNNPKLKVEYLDNKVEDDSIYKMVNLEKKDKYTVFLDGNHSLVKITSQNTNGKKIIIIKDSYANSLVPFLTPQYSEIYMIDLRYYYEDINKFIEENNINEALLVYNANTFFEENSISKLAW